MPEGIKLINHHDIMSYEEILRLCAIFANMGVSVFRVTGGEPLTRKGCVDFIRELKNISGVQHVMLTTNGLLLEPHLEELVALGLDGLNVSLDSLSPETYQQITGYDGLEQVLNSIDKAMAAGIRVKVNCVPIQGVNDGEITEIAGLAEKLPVTVRFIELMPAGAGDSFQGVIFDDIVERLKDTYSDLQADGAKYGFGPAGYYKSKKLKGRIGFIGAMSHNFCSSCNRLRLTSEGFLKLCLHHGDGLDLRRMLRDGTTDSGIETAIVRAIQDKPEKHAMSSVDGIKRMSQIGG
jgi:cyclic pyranopterin phosphate synthase